MESAPLATTCFSIGFHDISERKTKKNQWSTIFPHHIVVISAGDKMDFVKKSDHRIGGLPVVRLTFRGVQPLTALVQRRSLRSITCPAHLILLNLA
ncbi:hypothetical protein ANCDUO_24116 [Ancylostoma duodenale]|uniref:Uncharacterized protein n=1 Tax=Ancylostoma duodenale TaxID=51022 RepID=A0A0C2BPX8_9BILA|nr:hypothetical protein ANCDUO_24116 [Ancylostoma duodenale]